MVSFFLLPFQARCPVPAPPLSAGSFAQAQGSEWGVLRWGKGGRARSSGSCSPLPCATLASHPTPTLARIPVTKFCHFVLKSLKAEGEAASRDGIKRKPGILNTVPEHKRLRKKALKTRREKHCFKPHS